MKLMNNRLASILRMFMRWTALTPPSPSRRRQEDIPFLNIRLNPLTQEVNYFIFTLHES